METNIMKSHPLQVKGVQLAALLPEADAHTAACRSWGGGGKRLVLREPSDSLRTEHSPSNTAKTGLSG